MAIILSVLALCQAPPADLAAFSAARPVWAEGRETEKNLNLVFTATIARPDEGDLALCVTASTVYRAWAGGHFVGYGPARGPHGFYRVDRWPLNAFLEPGQEAELRIEVAGYNVNSYYLLDQPSFLQAEVKAGETVLAATGSGPAAFAATLNAARVQKVQRYSFQRPFIEYYRRSAPELAPLPLAPLEAKVLLPRGVQNPTFRIAHPVSSVASGRIELGVAPDTYWRDRSLVAIGPLLGGYPMSELEVLVSDRFQEIRQVSREDHADAPYETEQRIALGEHETRILRFDHNLSGFIGLTVTCEAPATLALTFDEILREGDVDFRRLGCVNAVVYELTPGTHQLETFDPYTLQYLKLMSLEGVCQISHVFVREYTLPLALKKGRIEVPVPGLGYATPRSAPGPAHFHASDERLNKLFDAGVATFEQNAVDVFMDCPSRERAGWLCDSFFTARVEHALTGLSRVEHNFFQNFLLPESFEHLPKGMLPMCYPADHNDGVFIPNWALWFVIQLDEYARRSGDTATVEGLEAKVMALFDYFAPFRNADGLLEKLQSWVFVEWSKANEFVQDVNYPSNMLYAGALDAAGRLYGRKDLREEAARLREVIRKQSFDGAFFADNALKTGNALEVTKNHSEVCQYFAFYLDVASPETHPDLWRKLQDEFGPARVEKGLYPEVHPANSFVGNMLRFELLSRHGRNKQILDESAEYLLYMAERTGTLWENIHDDASCNHGFASHIVNTLYRDVLGIYAVDTVNKKVSIRFADVELASCEGHRPVPEGVIEVVWHKEGDHYEYSVTVPQGYEVSISTLGDAEFRPSVRL